MAKDDEKKPPKEPDRVPNIPLDTIVKHDDQRAEKQRERWNEEHKDKGKKERGDN